MRQKKADKPRAIRFIDEEIDFLKEYYREISISEIVRILVHRHVEELRGLRSSPNVVLTRKDLATLPAPKDAKHE
jgi:uncharacterized protein with ATP-grasp and redox domains